MSYRRRVFAAAAVLSAVIACGGGSGNATWLDLGWQRPGDSTEDPTSSWEAVLSSSERAPSSTDPAGSGGGVACLVCGQNYKCTTTIQTKSETSIVSTTTSSGACRISEQIFRRDGSLYDEKGVQIGSWSCQGGAFVGSFDVTVTVKGGQGAGTTTTSTATVRCEPTSEQPRPQPTGTTTAPPPGQPPPAPPDGPPPVEADAGTRGTVADYGRCNVTGDCASQGATCLLRVCTPACSGTSPCPAPPPGRNLTPQCVAGRCVMSCGAQGATCPTGMSCISGICGYN
jgi:hypothetical protein